MKSILLLILALVAIFFLLWLTGCSSSKKIEVTAVKQMSASWKVDDETEVVNYQIMYAKDSHTAFEPIQTVLPGSKVYKIYFDYKPGYYSVRVNLLTEIKYTNVKRI